MFFSLESQWQQLQISLNYLRYSKIDKGEQFVACPHSYEHETVLNASASDKQTRNLSAKTCLPAQGLSVAGNKQANRIRNAAGQRNITHKARGVVISHSLGIPEGLQQWVSADDLILERSL